MISLQLQPGLLCTPLSMTIERHHGTHENPVYAQTQPKETTICKACCRCKTALTSV